MSLLPPSHPTPPGHQSARLGSLCYIAASHQLSVLHMIVYICQCYFLRSSSCISTVQFSYSVMSNSLQPHGLGPTRLLGPWDFLGKSIEVGCPFLLQGIFLTQGLNLGLPLLGRLVLSEPYLGWLKCHLT